MASEREEWNYDIRPTEVINNYNYVNVDDAVFRLEAFPPI